MSTLLIHTVYLRSLIDRLKVILKVNDYLDGKTISKTLRYPYSESLLASIDNDHDIGLS